jgi:hypothetical protein
VPGVWDPIRVRLTALPLRAMMGSPRHMMDSQNRPVERRILRQPLPPCEACGRTNVHVATRTERFVYMRVRDCLETWSVLKTAWPASEGAPNRP